MRRSSITPGVRENPREVRREASQVPITRRQLRGTRASRDVTCDETKRSENHSVTINYLDQFEDRFYASKFLRNLSQHSQADECCRIIRGMILINGCSINKLSRSEAAYAGCKRLKFDWRSIAIARSIWCSTMLTHRSIRHSRRSFVRGTRSRAEKTCGKRGLIARDSETCDEDNGRDVTTWVKQKRDARPAPPAVPRVAINSAGNINSDRTKIITNHYPCIRSLYRDENVTSYLSRIREYDWYFECSYIGYTYIYWS